MKDWLWDYDLEDVFTSSKRNKEFRLRRKFLYGTEEEFLSEALGNGDLSTIPREYRRYLQLFREKISMAGQKTLLNKAQQDFLHRFKKSRLGSRFFLSGGTALAEFYLCHRISEDLDFFCGEEFSLTSIEELAKRLTSTGKFRRPTIRRILNRTILTFPGQLVVEFDYMPFANIEKPTIQRGIKVDSLVDIGVNKLHALLERREPKDFVDLYFILRHHYLLRDLLKLMRSKFDVGLRKMDVGAALLRVEEIRRLPRLLKPVSRKELISFFTEAAKII